MSLEEATAPPPVPATPDVLLASDDARSHERALSVLHAHGIRCSAYLVERGDMSRLRMPGTGAIVVILSTLPVPARIAALRTLVEDLDQAHVVAAMPSATSGSLLRKTLRTGVDGIFHDESLAESMVPTVRAVAAGQLAVPRSLRRDVAPPLLTHREKEVLALVADGLGNRQVADRLYVAESTVKTHLSSAFAKLDVRSRAEATALLLDREEAQRLGITAITQTNHAATRLVIDDVRPRVSWSSR